MRQEKSAGVVIHRDGEFLLLKYEAGHWGFVKGLIEEKESPEKTVLRECKEETGIKGLEFVDGFKKRVVYFFKRDGKLTKKEVVFFLAETDRKRITLSEEHTDYVWLEFYDALEKLTYKNTKNLLRKAKEHLERQ